MYDASPNHIIQPIHRWHILYMYDASIKIIHHASYLCWLCIVHPPHAWSIIRMYHESSTCIMHTTCILHIHHPYAWCILHNPCACIMHHPFASCILYVNDASAACIMHLPHVSSIKHIPHASSICIIQMHHAYSSTCIMHLSNASCMHHPGGLDFFVQLLFHLWLLWYKSSSESVSILDKNDEVPIKLKQNWTLLDRLSDIYLQTDVVVPNIQNLTKLIHLDLGRNLMKPLNEDMFESSSKHLKFLNVLKNRKTTSIFIIQMHDAFSKTMALYMCTATWINSSPLSNSGDDELVAAKQWGQAKRSRISDTHRLRWTLQLRGINNQFSPSTFLI